MPVEKNSIVSEISVVLRVTDDYFAAEGIQAGQLLVVNPVNGFDVSGSVVVALFDKKPIIRRFERSGNAEFRPLRRDSLSAPMGHRSFLLCPPLRVSSKGLPAKRFPVSFVF